MLRIAQRESIFRLRIAIKGRNFCCFQHCYLATPEKGGKFKEGASRLEAELGSVGHLVTCCFYVLVRLSEGGSQRSHSGTESSREDARRAGGRGRVPLGGGRNANGWCLFGSLKLLLFLASKFVAVLKKNCFQCACSIFIFSNGVFTVLPGW